MGPPVKEKCILQNPSFNLRTLERRVLPCCQHLFSFEYRAQVVASDVSEDLQKFVEHFI